jgi:hypothetical protein
MRRIAVSLVVACAISLLAALPASAARIPRTGDRINLLDPPESAVAGQPFWVGQGFCSTTDDEDAFASTVNPSTRVTIAVDGMQVSTGTDVSIGVGECVVRKFDYHNFRFGLPAGVHTFKGCWYWLGALQFCEQASIAFH